MLLEQAALLSKKRTKGFQIKCETPASAFSSLMSCCTTSQMVQTCTVQNCFFFGSFKLEQPVPGQQCTAGHCQQHSHSPLQAPKQSLELFYLIKTQWDRGQHSHTGVCSMLPSCSSKNCHVQLHNNVIIILKPLISSKRLITDKKT